jgi:TonB family protein
MANPFYTRTSVLAAVVHGMVVLLLIAGAMIQGCLYRRKPVELIEFTVAVNTAENAEEPPPPPDDKPVPPPPRPPDPPEPDRISEPKPPDKQPPPKKPPDKKPVEKKTAENKPIKKKPIQKGSRVVRGPPKPPVRQTLSDEEIAKWLKNRARIGERDSLPDSEQARSFAIVHDELYAAWEQPPLSNAGTRPAEVEFALDFLGRISGARIVQSSGSPVFDNSVLEAVRRVGRVDGLSAAFLRAYPRLSVEFKLTQ